MTVHVKPRRPIQVARSSARPGTIAGVTRGDRGQGPSAGQRAPLQPSRASRAAAAPAASPPPPSPAAPPAAPPRPTFEPGQAFTLPLWEARSQAWLLQQKADNPRMFRRGMQQQPLEDGESLFARGIERFLRYGVASADLARPGAPRFGGFDPAGERRLGNALSVAALGDAVAVTVPTMDGPGSTHSQYERLRVVVAVERWANRVTTPGTSPYLYTAQRLAGEHARHRFETLMLESNATQGAISALTLTVDASIPFDHVVTSSKKNSEDEGLPGLAVEMERGLWALSMDDAHGTGSPLKDHDPLCDCAWCTLIGDVVAYPDPTRGEYDALMSLLFCWTAIRRGAWVDDPNAAPGVVTLPGGGWGEVGSNYFVSVR